MQMYLAPDLIPSLKNAHHIPSDGEMAKLLGCDRSTLHRMENHEVPLNPSVASRIAARFHVPFSRIAAERMERTSNGR